MPLIPTIVRAASRQRRMDVDDQGPPVCGFTTSASARSRPSFGTKASIQPNPTSKSGQPSHRWPSRFACFWRRWASDPGRLVGVTEAECLTVIDKRTIVTRGLLSKSAKRVLHRDIRNIRVDQSVLERTFGAGRIEISSSGQGDIEICFGGVPASGCGRGADRSPSRASSRSSDRHGSGAIFYGRSRSRARGYGPVSMINSWTPASSE